HIDDTFLIGDIPVSLVDTAGIRDTVDVVENLGVERSRAVMADADLVLLLLDASEPLTGDDRALFEQAAELNFIVALNKIDKVSEREVDEFTNDRVLRNVREKITCVSAKNRQGLDQLGTAIIEPFTKGRQD